MIKRILIPLDPSPYTDAALDYACHIAKQNEAELTGLAVLDHPGIQDSVGAVPMGGSYYAKKLREDNEQEALEQIDQLLAKFKKKCDGEGISCHKEEDQGSPAERIMEISKFYDLLIIGLKTHFKYGDDSDSGETVIEILDHTITPILAVPDSFKKSEPLKNVLIVFNGSLPASRALQRFAQIAIPENCSITLLISDDSTGDDLNAAHYYLDQAEAYLKAHAFVNITKKTTPRNIIDAMDEDYYDRADLIVAGTHSKKGLLDFFIGSLSKHLIVKAEKAVLLG